MIALGGAGAGAGRTALEAEFLDTVIGIPDSRAEIVVLRPPDGGTGLELASVIRPGHEPGWGSSCPWPSASADPRHSLFDR